MLEALRQAGRRRSRPWPLARPCRWLTPRRSYPGRLRRCPSSVRPPRRRAPCTAAGPASCCRRSPSSSSARSLLLFLVEGGQPGHPHAPATSHTTVVRHHSAATSDPERTAITQLATSLSGAGAPRRRGPRLRPGRHCRRGARRRPRGLGRRDADAGRGPPGGRWHLGWTVPRCRNGARGDRCHRPHDDGPHDDDPSAVRPCGSRPRSRRGQGPGRREIERSRRRRSSPMPAPVRAGRGLPAWYAAASNEEPRPHDRTTRASIHVSIDERTAVAPNSDFDPDALREKYRLERDKRVRTDGNAQYIEAAGTLRGLSPGSLRRAHRPARPQRRGHGRHHRRWLRRPHHRGSTPSSRHRRCADHREGR